MIRRPPRTTRTYTLSLDDALPIEGELWLCGKHFVGPDVEAAVRRVGADVVLCLNEHHELADRYPAYVRWLGTDERAWWVPVPDLHAPPLDEAVVLRSEEHTSELQSLMRITYAVFCSKTKKQ